MTDTRNAQAILEVAAHIETYPERYNQTEWGQDTDCGSAFCVAGTRAVLDGIDYETNCVVRSDRRRAYAWLEVVSVGLHAQDRFGLSDMEAKILFSQHWLPREGMTVPEALRRLAAGWPVVLVTAESLTTFLPYAFAGASPGGANWVAEAQHLLDEADEFVKAHA